MNSDWLIQTQIGEKVLESLKTFHGYDNSDAYLLRGFTHQTVAKGIPLTHWFIVRRFGGFVTEVWIAIYCKHKQAQNEKSERLDGKVAVVFIYRSPT